MVPTNEITSTEKLLDLIREKPGVSGDEGQAAPQNVRAEVPPATSDSKDKSTPQVLPLHKSVTVGIDIGHLFLRLVKMTKGSDSSPKLVELRSVPLPAGAAKGSAEYESFLRSEISAFCRSAKKVEVWVIMSAARVDVRHIRIPKVPKKQLANAVNWSARRELTINEREDIFDFTVLGEVADQGIPKLAIMYYTAPRQEVEDMKKMFSRIGVPLTGVSITPFAIQNIFRTGWIPGREGTLVHLYIGNDFSRIDIYTGGNLVMTRGIKAGTNSMAESLSADFNELRHGLPHNGSSSDLIDSHQAGKILASLSPDAPPLHETDPGFGLSKEEIFGMIRPALERLTKQVERTFEYYNSLPGNERIERMYITSAYPVYRPIVDYVGDQLGIDRDIFDALREDLPGIIHKDRIRTINTSERTALGPALGMALSDVNTTPNFIFTFKDREQKASVQRINQAVFGIFIAVVIACSGIFVYEFSSAAQKKSEIAKLEKRLSRYTPRVDREMIMAQIASSSRQRQSAKAYSERYLSMAVFGEISDLTPKNISLVNIDANSSTVTGAPDKGKSEASQGNVGKIMIEGVILGEQNTLESVLAGYVMRLDASPLFQSVKVVKSNSEIMNKRQVLRFTVEAKIG